jgi:parvulin-like peptidyl-prolyl isomerase
MKSEQRAEAPMLRPVQSAVLLAMAAAFIVVAGSTPAYAQAAADAAPQAPVAAAAPAAAAAVFANVGKAVITSEQYEAAFAQAARGKFYHGKPPEAEVAKLQREVGQKLVDEILLVAEAKRRNIQPDPAAVQKTIDGYDERYKDSAQWKANRARVLPGLKAKLEADNVMEQLTAQARNVPEPSEAEVQKYYADHKDKFTSPEQVHLRMILLKMDPSSSKPQWDAAREEGAAISKRLKAGANFEELAHLHSGDASAKRGGDMGYLHRGMLPEPAQKVVDDLKKGEISDAVTLLEGVAVFRLDDRKEPVLNSFESVKQRARDLYVRDRADQAWDAFIAKLRKDTPIKLDESRFLPLAAAGDKAPAQ